MNCIDCKRKTAVNKDNQCFRCGKAVCSVCGDKSNTLMWYELKNGFDLLLCIDCREWFDLWNSKKSLVKK